MNSNKGYSVERGFISKLLETKDMKLVKDEQIKMSFFTGEHKRVYSFIFNQFKETGEIPTERVIKLNFPNYRLEKYVVDNEEKVGTEESLQYWCQQLHIKSMHNKTADVVENIVDLLEKGESQEAYELMKKGVWSIEDEIMLSTSVDITKDTEDRKEKYLERKKNQGMMGIPTGINHLDYIIKGFVDETLTTIIASSGVGKTWLLVLMASYAMLNNYKVCMFVTEMSSDLMQDRFDAMLYGMIRGDFNYSAFRSGKLSSESEDSYFDFLEEDLPKLEPLIIETATGVSSIVSVIQQEKPDIIFIDGVYLMEDERNAKDDWLRVAHITRDLKKVAKNWHLPIVINSQADKSTSKKKGPELGSIMYTQSIGQDSDNVLALFRDEIMINDKEMGIKVLKQREGTLGKVTINWDFTKMNFDSIFSENEAEDDFSDEEHEENVLGVDD